MSSFVTTAFKGRERETAGATLGILLVTAAETPARSMTTVADVGAEVVGDDYARAETGIFGGIEVVDSDLVLDWVESTDPDADPIDAPLFQVGDVAQIAGAWTYIIPDDATDDSDRQLVAYTGLGIVSPGSSDFPLERIHGYAVIGDNDDLVALAARVTALEALLATIAVDGGIVT